ncbi:MAG: tetratricopeptide repeat protein [Candidatus Wallbacteria bacterium]|nr:tetratricopeptide repeat protein [Candidatus Wallbacteria bacterium]
MTELDKNPHHAVNEQIRLLLQSEDETERKQAIIQLAKKPSRENFLTLQKIADFDESVEVRFYAKKALNVLKSRITPKLSEKKTAYFSPAEIENFFEGKTESSQAVPIIQHLVNTGLKEKLPELITVLNREKDSNILAALLIAIGKFGSESEIKTIAPFLSHEIPRVRANAIDALEMIGSERAYPFVISKLEDADNRVRANAVRFVRELGGVNTLKILRTMAGSPGVAMRASAAYVLQYFPTQENMETVLTLFNDRDLTVRNNALKTLLIFKKKGVGKAEEILKKLGKEAEIKAESLEEIEHETQDTAETRDRLKTVLNSSDPGMRLKAIVDTVEKGSGGAILLEHLSKENDHKAIATIIIGLGKLQYRKALPVLVKYLKSKDARCRANAVEAIRLINDKDKLKEIIPLLKDENNRTRANSILALKDEKNAGIYASLLEMVKSETKEMQLSVIYVIMELEDLDYYEFLLELERSGHPEVSKKARDSIKTLESQGIKVLIKTETERSSRVFRIYVSSTFSDLREEREALQAKVFPKLSKLCRQHGYRFQAVDLRFLITEEDAIDQQTMKICLSEIKRCQAVSPRPNFMILLGDRYGWRPLPAEIPESEYYKISEKLRVKIKMGKFTAEDLKLLDSWYKRDLNALSKKKDSETLWVLQQRTGEYAELKCWEKVEQRLSHILRQATGDFQGDRRLFYNVSAVAQEIVKGALEHSKNAKKHVFCFFRKISNLDDLKIDLRSKKSQVKDFVDTDAGGAFDQESHGLSDSLKNMLYKTLPQNIFEYDARWEKGKLTTGHIDKMCRDVYQALSCVILDKIAHDVKLTPLAKEIINHENFRLKIAKNFTGRGEYRKFIADYLKPDVEPKAPLAIYGQAGSGKSALLAQSISDAIEKYGRNTEQSTFVVIHRFLGNTPDSSTLHSLLESLCRQIAHHYGIDEKSIPCDDDGLEMKFLELLRSATARKPLLLFLDALDQLPNDNHAHELRWLPPEIPENVRLVVSTSAGAITANDKSRDDSESCLEHLKKKIPQENIKELQNMPASEGSLLLDCWLKKAGRQLTGEQRSLILDNFKRNGNPLYLKIAFGEARRWKSFTKPEEIKLSADLAGIIKDLFKRLSLPQNCGEMIVSRILGYLAAGRNGLSEEELLEILAADPDFYGYLDSQLHLRLQKSIEKKQIPFVVWARLHFELAPYLLESMIGGSYLLTFLHRQFSMAAKEMYLSGQDRKKLHQVLAGYFENNPGMDDRKFDELPWQLCRAENWSGLKDCITDLSMFKKFLLEGRRSELTGYWASLAGRFDMVQSYNLMIENHENTSPAAADFALLINQTASFLQDNARYEGAESLFRKALSIQEKEVGSEHPDTALSLNNLATLLKNKGDYGGAELLYYRALAIWEKALGPDHPNTALSLNDLAMLLYNKGDYEGAEPLLRKALAIREKSLGPEHPDTALSLNNFAMLLYNKEDYQEAEPLLRKALAIWEKVLGPEHPDTARSLDNLAGLLKNKGSYCEAEPLYRRALAIREKVLDPEHPDTALSLHNLATLLVTMGDNLGAEPLYRRALIIWEKVLTPDHPWTRAARNNLDSLLQRKQKGTV